MMKTTGYSRTTAGGLQVRTPAEEADDARAYLLDYLHLPAALVVDETPYRRLPDGRRVDGAVAFEQRYGSNTRYVISDREGRLTAFGSDMNEDLLAAYIGRAVAR
jgi:hypothetical protein